MPEFGDIVGQDAAITRIQRAMAGSRMPHAYIFAGPAGVGRRTTAVALAKTLLCEQPVDVPRPARVSEAGGEAGGSVHQMRSWRQACGECTDCQMISGGTHGDFHLIYKELARYHEKSQVRDRVMQDLGIDVIRSFLIAPAARAPSRGRGKVFVVLEAELMSDAAQNAMLKTLEEPPDGVTIILICRQPERMLPTTLSRCSMVRFSPLPRGFVTERLIAEGVAAPEAKFFSAFTAGSIGRAMRMSAEGMYQVKRDAIERLVAMGPAGDAELGEYLAKRTESLAVAAVKAVRKESGVEMSKLLATRRASGAMLELIAGAYRDAIHLAAADRDRASAPPETINADQFDAIRTIARRFDATQLASIIQQLSEYEELLWRNVSPRIVWDNVVVTCASAAPLRVQ